MNILVVDDDFMVARVHGGYVARIPGCRVIGVAHRGEEALELVAELRPDLVLLDIYLPDMSGLDVLRRLRTGAPDDPFVLVITAANDTATVGAALQGGALHYLVKPFESDALQKQVERAMRIRGRLSATDRAGQEDIDRLFGEGARSRAAHMPKGLTRPTAELVERVLRSHHGDLSAAECAELAELSRVSARRYLEYFVEIGTVIVRLRYGGTGRPERRYRWGSDAGQA
ncbi:MAG: hypothetical protein QOI36_1575 [Pseudonocardiales bacterium]|jgi:response regulator of citrate/malate metabolism|nr:hypothetical protein [Pseudonocardiales bacterium]